MEYDALRAQLAKAKKEAEEAKKKQADESDEAEKAYKDAKEAEKKAQEDADDAAKKAADAKKAAEEVAYPEAAGNQSTGIEAAKQKVEDKIKNLDDCKQQLKDAQDELK